MNVKEISLIHMIFDYNYKDPGFIKTFNNFYISLKRRVYGSKSAYSAYRLIWKRSGTKKVVVIAHATN